MHRRLGTSFVTGLAAGAFALVTAVPAAAGSAFLTVPTATPADLKLEVTPANTDLGIVDWTKGSITIQATVTNAGGEPAPDVILGWEVTDIPPPTFTGPGSENCARDASTPNPSSQVTDLVEVGSCALGRIGPQGKVGPITFTTRPDKEMIGQPFHILLNLGYTQVDFHGITGPIPPGADLAVHAKAGSIRRGKTATYQLTMVNHGPATATSVTLSDTLGKHLRFRSVRGTGCHHYGNGIRCTWPSLAHKQKVKVTLLVKAGKKKRGVTVNTATVGSATPDPNPANNTVRTRSTIR